MTSGLHCREMWPIYLLPVAAIAAAAVYFQTMRARMSLVAAPARGPIGFHEVYAKHFDFQAHEFVVAFWQGTVYLGSDALQRGGVEGVAGWLASDDDGNTRHRPSVIVVLTTLGRVLLAEQHGGRDDLVQVREWNPGASAAIDAQGMGNDFGDAVVNPFNASVPLELTVLSGPGDDAYYAWLSPQGGMLGSGQWHSIHAVLPITAAEAALKWEAALKVSEAPNVQ